MTRQDQADATLEQNVLSWSTIVAPIALHILFLTSSFDFRHILSVKQCTHRDSLNLFLFAHAIGILCEKVLHTLCYEAIDAHERLGVVSVTAELRSVQK